MAPTNLPAEKCSVCDCSDGDHFDWCSAGFKPPVPLASNERSYRCFFCDEEFSGVDATNHFGKSQSAEPACKIKAAGEFALLQALRNAEEDLNRYRAEDSDTQRAMHSMIADHQVALRREEEKGYERGLRDAKHVETNGDHAELLKKIPRVSAEFIAEVRELPRHELERRVLIQKDWLHSYSQCLDGLGLKVGLESARDPRDIRRAIESVLKGSEQAANPVPIENMCCPKCERVHIDEGEWATRPHKTHQCQHCGHEWRPHPYATVGVAVKTRAEPDPHNPAETLVHGNTP